MSVSVCVRASVRDVAGPSVANVGLCRSTDLVGLRRAKTSRERFDGSAFRHRLQVFVQNLTASCRQQLFADSHLGTITNSCLEVCRCLHENVFAKVKTMLHNQFSAMLSCILNRIYSRQL